MQQWKLDPKDATLVALKMEEDVPKERPKEFGQPREAGRQENGLM